MCLPVKLLRALARDYPATGSNNQEDSFDHKREYKNLSSKNILYQVQVEVKVIHRIVR